jgi:hypothetical protein
MSYKTADGQPCDGNGRITPSIGNLLDQAYARKARLNEETSLVECSRLSRHYGNPSTVKTNRGKIGMRGTQIPSCGR